MNLMTFEEFERIIKMKIARLEVEGKDTQLLRQIVEADRHINNTLSEYYGTSVPREKNK